MGFVRGQDLVGQRTIDSERRRWQRAVDGLNPDAKPKIDTENYVHPQYLLRAIQQPGRQKFLVRRPSEGIDPTTMGERDPPGGESFKRDIYHEKVLPVSIRVKLRIPAIGVRMFNNTPPIPKIPKIPTQGRAKIMPG